MVTYKEWIAVFKGVDAPLGDLAKDVLEDEDFPEDATCKFEIFEYLINAYAGIDCLEIFDQSWPMYEAVKRDSENASLPVWLFARKRYGQA